MVGRREEREERGRRGREGETDPTRLDSTKSGKIALDTSRYVSGLLKIAKIAPHWATAGGEKAARGRRAFSQGALCQKERKK